MPSLRRLLAKLVLPIQTLSQRANDVSNEDGRAKERLRRIYLSALTALCAKVVSFLALIVTVPITLHYLGVERYGVWMTITSFLALLSFADLGLGLGLLNATAHASGRDNPGEMQSSISNAFFMLCGMAVILLASAATLIPLVNWGTVFNVHSPRAVQEIAPTLLTMVGTIAFAMPIGIVQRVQLGLQEGYLSNLWQIGASLASLGSVLVAVNLGASLPVLVVAFSGVPLLVTLLNWGHFFYVTHPQLRPRLSYLSRVWILRLARVGIGFAILQTGYQLAYSLDNLVIARELGSKEVSEYAVSVRLFSIIPMIASLIAVPLWPAFGEAFTRGDFRWMKRTLMTATGVTFFFSLVASLLIAAFSRFLVAKWAGTSVVPSMPLAFGIAVWVAIDSVRVTTSTFFNSLGVIRFQIGVFFVYGVVSLALKVLFANKYGLAGVVWAANFCFPVLFIGPTIISLNRFFKSGKMTCPAAHPETPAEQIDLP